MANAEEIKLWNTVNKAILKSLETFGDVFSKDVTRYLLANDVVPVVRCKDCKFYELKNYVVDNTQRMCCENNKGIWTATRPDDFCSYGERKSDG